MLRVRRYILWGKNLFEMSGGVFTQTGIIPSRPRRKHTYELELGVSPIYDYNI